LAALGIGVLDAQNKAAAGFSRPQIAEKRRPRIAEVQ